MYRSAKITDLKVGDVVLEGAKLKMSGRVTATKPAEDGVSIRKGGRTYEIRGAIVPLREIRTVVTTTTGSWVAANDLVVRVHVEDEY
jgi:hypothetical protein